jgi:hypothetical protein
MVHHDKALAIGVLELGSPGKKFAFKILQLPGTHVGFMVLWFKGQGVRHQHLDLLGLGGLTFDCRYRGGTLDAGKRKVKIS